MPRSGVRLEPTFQKQTRPRMRSGLAHRAPAVAGGRPCPPQEVLTPQGQSPSPLRVNSRAAPSRGEVCAE